MIGFRFFRGPACDHRVVLETNLAGLTLARRGKVRDVYDLGAHLLIVATDRISAFDYVLGSGIPDKGKVLTQLSAFWFDHLGDLVPHHVVAVDVDTFPAVTRPHRDVLRGRSMLVQQDRRRCRSSAWRAAISSGSGWKDYQQTGAVCGIPLPPGLRESDRLPAADLHAGDQGRVRPRREHQRSAGRRDRRRAISSRACAS